LEMLGVVGCVTHVLVRLTVEVLPTHQSGRPL
jgi:hypothetical protein